MLKQSKIKPLKMQATEQYRISVPYFIGTWKFIYLFNFGLIDDAVRSSDYTALNDRMINESEWI
jgi:hypothetical protein